MWLYFFNSVSKHISRFEDSRVSHAVKVRVVINVFRLSSFFFFTVICDRPIYSKIDEKYSIKLRNILFGSKSVSELKIKKHGVFLEICSEKFGMDDSCR